MRSLRPVGLACIALLLAGRAAAQTPAPSPALWSFHHLSADAPALDIYIDGGRAITALNFTDVSDYVHVAPGGHRVQITIAGHLDLLASTTATLDSGQSYTWVLSGLISGADLTVPLTPDLQFSRYIALTSNAGATADMRSRVRVVNASPGSGQLDVRVDDLGGLALASALTYGNIGPYSTLGAGTYSLSVYPTGSMTPLLAHLGFTLEERRAYTLVVGGLEPNLIAADAPNPVRGLLAQRVPDFSSARTAVLNRGCNLVILNLPVGTQLRTMLTLVEDPSHVVSIWRFDNATKAFKAGYFGDATVPTDYQTTSASPEAPFVCVSATMNWSPPG